MLPCRRGAEMEGERMDPQEDLQQRLVRLRFAVLVILAEEEMGSLSDLLLFAGQEKRTGNQAYFGCPLQSHTFTH